SILISLSAKELGEWLEAYQSDPVFAEVLARLTLRSGGEDSSYFKGDNGLLYFEDWHGNNKLCVPQGLRSRIMGEIHNTKTESAHSG
ncbi:hypothetical protein K435DRAFT_632504, partial [Dendrothele bispora CBS 962.96]